MNSYAKTGSCQKAGTKNETHNLESQSYNWKGWTHNIASRENQMGIDWAILQAYETINGK